MLDQLLVIAGVTILVMISPGPDMLVVLRHTLLGAPLLSLGLRVALIDG